MTLGPDIRFAAAAWFYYDVPMANGNVAFLRFMIISLEIISDVALSIRRNTGADPFHHCHHLAAGHHSQRIQCQSITR